MVRRSRRIARDASPPSSRLLDAQLSDRSVTSPIATCPTRAIVIVLDSVGIGELPDAATYGDEGSDTLGNIARAGAAAVSRPCARSAWRAWRASATARRGRRRSARVGRMAEASAGKDSVTGHWEMMGVVLDRPFPVFPGRLPAPTSSRSSRG